MPAPTNKDARAVYEAIQAHNRTFPNNKVMNFCFHVTDNHANVQVFVEPPLNYRAKMKLDPPPPSAEQP